jgi:hypothetical protein
MASANDIVFNVKDAGGTWRQLKCKLKSFTYDDTGDVTEDATFCETTKAVGTPKISISWDGIFDDGTGGADTSSYHYAMKTLRRLGQRTEFQYGPETSAAGATLHSGYGWVTKYTTVHQANGVTQANGGFSVDGTDALTVWP